MEMRNFHTLQKVNIFLSQDDYWFFILFDYVFPNYNNVIKSLLFLQFVECVRNPHSDNFGSATI